MYLHEYQGKNIFKRYNILTPKSFLFNKFDYLKYLDNFNCSLISDKCVLKAQIHSGSRASYGGIIFIDKLCDLRFNLEKLFSLKISTNQTLGEYKIIEKVLLEEFLEFSNSFYLSFFVDSVNDCISILFSSYSGSFIENASKDFFLKLTVEPIFGISDYHIRCFLKYLNLDSSLFNKAKFLLCTFFDIFIAYDLILLEVNPLVLRGNDFYCLDSKLEVDDNSFFRQKNLFLDFDLNQVDYLELEAKKFGLNYISLSGCIGCLVNGAGLAMATMDLIHFCGGNAANFLDIGGDATSERVFNAIRIILLNKNVKCIFVNIFGGIVKCDLIAHSIVDICKFLDIKLPIVVRFVGNMADAGFDIVSVLGNIYCEKDFYLAVEKTLFFSKDVT